MRYLIMFLLFTVWLACTQAGADSPSRVNAMNDPGKQIFRTHCVLCHGAKGDLQLNGAKVLGQSELTLKERIAVITNGRNVMTPFGKILSEEEIRQVAQYTFTFSDTTDVE